MRLGDVARGAAERSARRAEDVAQLGDVLLAHVVDGVSSEPALLSAIAKVRKPKLVAVVLMVASVLAGAGAAV